MESGGARPSAPLEPAFSVRCIATTRAGKPCGAPRVGRDGKCISHTEDPEKTVLAAAGRSKGGKKARLVLGVPQDWKVDLSTAEAAVASVEAAIEGVARGQISASAGNAIASLVRVALEIQQANVQVQLDQLVARINELQDGRR